MDQIDIGKTIIKNFFDDRSISDLWKTCNCQMLWEAIKKEDATFISRPEILQQLQNAKYVFILPELLPTLYIGSDPSYMAMRFSDLERVCEAWSNNPLIRGNCIFEIEPLYIVSCDFRWMIVLTTENTPSGEQLCILMHGLGLCTDNS